MEKEVILVGGLGYGDEGKGSIVDYLVRTKKAGVVIRFNGGAQAGHNVVTPRGLHHTFAQFGSGTLVPGVETHLSRFMVVNPLGMMREEEYLQSLGIKDAFHRTTIDRDALVTTPFQIAINRLLEIWRGDKKHGSCGIGIGQTVKDYQKYGDKVLFVKDLQDPVIMGRKLKFLQEQSRESAYHIISDLQQTKVVEKELEWLEDKSAVDDLVRYFLGFAGLAKIVDGSHLANLLNVNSSVVFEGAQGALLDNDYGFYPHTTKTDTTFTNAYKLLESAGNEGRVTRIGVLRGYATRHGAGPFVTEDDNLAKYLRDPHNLENKWQGKLRIGWLDILSIRYGILVNDGVDCLALTNLDQLSGLEAIKFCISYEYKGELNVLDPYFEWETIGKKRARILAFKKPDINSVRNEELAQILFQCKPLEFVELRGWQQDITKIKGLKYLPSQTQEYLKFIESPEGLNVPIKIISVSPTWEGKIFLL